MNYDFVVRKEYLFIMARSSAAQDRVSRHASVVIVVLRPLRFRFAHMGATAPIPPVGQLPEESPLVWLEPPPLALLDVKPPKTLIKRDLIVGAGSGWLCRLFCSHGPI